MDSDPLDITETERSRRIEPPLDPQLEIWHLMHRYAVAMRAAREEAGRRQADEQGRFRVLVIDLARAHHQLKVFLERNTEVLEGAGLQEQADLLTTIRNRYEGVLKRAGAELIYFDGQPLTSDLVDKVKVIASVPSEDVDQPRVRETVSPGVKLHFELACCAEVEVAVPSRPFRTGEHSAPTGGPSHEPQEATDEPRDRD